MTHPIPPDLIPWVDALWTLDTAAGVGWTEHIWPTLHADLIFGSSTRFLRDGHTVSGSVIDGVGLQARRFEHTGEGRLTGVRLRPGAISSVGAPAAELRGRVVALATARDGPWDDPDPRLRVAGATAWLRSTLDSTRRPLERWLRVVLASDRVDEAARRLGVCERTLRRRLVSDVGIGPKAIQRLARFHRTATRLEREYGTSRFALVHLEGYADQAHFSRECRALTGHPPTHWWGVSDSFKHR